MKRVGKTDIYISDLVYGCWQTGDSYWGDCEEQAAMENIRTAFELGIHTFDTAYLYGMGRSEMILGQAVKNLPREKCCLISKLWQMQLHYDEAIRNCEDSLRRLQTDYLDIYFIHYPDDTGKIPVEETLSALNLLKEQGKIRAIGLSNFSLRQMKEAMKYAQIDIIQPCYSLLWRYIDAKILPFCRENDIAVIPYSTLAQGLLTGGLNLTNRPQDDRTRVPLFQSPYYERAVEVAEVLEELSKNSELTPAEMALSWAAHKEGITAPIVGFRKKEKILSSLKAVSVRLSEEEERVLEKASKKFTDSLPFFKSFFENILVEDPDGGEQDMPENTV